MDAEYRVVKNTLFKLAAGDSMPVADMGEFLAGPTAIGFAKGDPVAVAKILLDYARDHKAMSVKAGVMDGRVLSAAQVDALSKTPPREVLLSQMIGSLQFAHLGLRGHFERHHLELRLHAASHRRQAGRGRTDDRSRVRTHRSACTHVI